MTTDKYWRNRVTDALARDEFQPGANWFEIPKPRYDELMAARNPEIVAPADNFQGRYVMSVEYMPDKAAVRVVSIRNYRMGSEELGKFVAQMDEMYKPLKIVVIREDLTE